jgi:hypothetical protein
MIQPTAIGGLSDLNGILHGFMLSALELLPWMTLLRTSRSWVSTMISTIFFSKSFSLMARSTAYSETDFE